MQVLLDAAYPFFPICFDLVFDEIQKHVRLTFRLHSLSFIGVSLEDEGNLFSGFLSPKACNRLMEVFLINHSLISDQRS